MALFCRYVFFLGLLIIGLLVFRDYGVHIDEYVNQKLGNENVAYLFSLKQNGSIAQTPPLMLNIHALIHGPCIELPLVILKMVLHITDVRNVLLMRHLCCFLIFFLGVYFFYLLCELHFKDWRWGLIGSLFLVLSPRIFANAFYNTADIPFLSFYVISIYTLLRWIRQKNFFNASMHALACACLIDIRPVGLILPLFTVFLFSWDIAKQQIPSLRNETMGQLLSSLILMITLAFLGWPLLWSHPSFNAMTVLNENYHFHFSFPCTYLFLGQELKQAALPWSYAPVWILITTPVFYIFCFIVGFFAAIEMIWKGNLFSQKRDNVLLIACFVVPLILANGKIYDTWRHVYFIYPVFLIFSLRGLVGIGECIDGKFKGIHRRLARGVMILITIVSLLMTSCFMIQNHPFEYVYFNSLAGRDMQEIKRKFSLDYWGLSFRQGLEIILKHDSSKIIKVSSGDNYLQFIDNNIDILPPEDRLRFQQTDIQDAKYFITNYQWHAQEEYPYPLLDAIKVGNARILGVYKLKSDKRQD